MFLAQGGEEPLLAELPAIQESPAVATHAAEERFALLELDAFLPQLFERVQEHLVPVFDLVADRQVEGLESWTDQIQLRRGQLQHPAHVVEEVADRSGQLRFGCDDLSGQRLATAEQGKFL